MLTLKNAFWVTLVLLNLTFILAVSYSRLKPTPEASPYPSDNKIVSEETSPDSANWRFASVNTHDIPDLELPSSSSPESLFPAPETTNKDAYRIPTPMQIETKATTNVQTAKSEIDSSKSAEASFGVSKVTSPKTANDSQEGNTDFSGKNEGLAKSDSATNEEDIASSSFTSDMIEVAAASMAMSRTAETADPDTGIQPKEGILSPEESNQHQETSYKVDTYYDGNLVRTEETDNNGNLQVTVKETMDGLANLSPNDANYVEALRQLDNSPQTPKTNTDEATASHLANEGSSKKSVDYFNKADVSSKKIQKPENKLTLADQLEAAVSTDGSSNDKDSTPNNPENDYFQALGTESAERANEMRTIKVVRGDTLWSISSRAYGSGFEYNKIFKANPYLSDPDKIEVGDTLRVPI